MNIHPPSTWDTEVKSFNGMDSDLIAPLVRRSMFWTPERQASSCWVEHVPFAFWIVDVLRPSRIVELGTHNGVSYSAFCQAVKTLGLGASCFAVDTWKKDDQASVYREEVFVEYAAFHDRRYGAFSRLVRSTFDEALPHFEDGSIDLLHIDGLHTYEAVRHYYESWLPKLATNAVVLLDGINVREKHLGICRLWSEISAGRSCFAFLHGNGLGVLGKGEDFPAALKALFETREDGLRVGAARETFAMLGCSVGALLEQTAAHRALSEHMNEIGSLRAAVTKRDSELTALRKAVVEKTNEIESLQGTSAAHCSELASLRQALHARANERTMLQQELKVLRTRDEVLSRIVTSHSWRLTKPLRFGGRLLRGDWHSLRLSLQSVVGWGAETIVPLLAPFHRRSRALQMAEFHNRNAAADKRKQSQIKAIFRTELKAKLQAFLATNDQIMLETSTSPEVSIIVVLYNAAELTLEHLKSLKQALNGRCEVILIDNNSTDQTRAVLKRVWGAKIIVNQENTHYLRAVNQGLKIAGGESILLVNNDTKLHPDAIRIAREVVISDPKVGAVGGKLISLDGTLQEAGSIIWNDGSCVGYGRGQRPNNPEYQFRREVDYCSGAFLMVRSALFSQLNGLDERYAPAYYEETDLCMRITAAGYRIVYEPRIEVLHFEFGSSTSIDQVVALQTRNRDAFNEVHGSTLSQYHYEPNTNQLKARSSSRKGRILIIDDGVPYPYLGAGFPRMRRIISEIDKAGWLITFYPVAFPTVDLEEARKEFPLEMEIIMGRGRDDLVNFLNERGGCYEAVLVSRPHNMSIFKDACKKVPRFLGGAHVIYDAEALFVEREKLRRELKGGSFSQDEYDAEMQLEVGLTSDADAVIAVSPREQAIFSEKTAAQVHVVGHSIQAMPTARPFEERRDILFVGALAGSSDISPNVDGLMWFVREVMPLLDRAIGTTYRLRVVGRIDIHDVQVRAKVCAMASNRVELLGQVDEISAFYASSRIFIAPTRFAAGLAHKVHEATAFGVPTVTTGLIGSQLGRTHGRDIMIGNSAPEFARACAALYSDEDLWALVRMEGLRRISVECSHEAFSSSVRAVMEKIPIRDIVLARRFQREPMVVTTKADEDDLRTARVNEVWGVDQETRAKACGQYWLVHPHVAMRANRKISGDPKIGIYQHLKSRLELEGWSFPVKTIVSLGCGFGGLERQLVQLGYADKVIGYDLAAAAIERAREDAQAANMHQIEYKVMDLEEALVGLRNVDMIVGNHSVHHIENLEGLCVSVKCALKRGGIFHLNEFVGPTRFQWSDAQLSAINDFLLSLPAQYRMLPSGELRGKIVRPTIEEMIAYDPSEAIRSSDIVTVVENEFKILERRDYGGALLHLGLSDIAQNFDVNNAHDRSLLDKFFEMEDSMMAEGVIGSDFTVITATS